jgi:hypothetical protein
VFEEFLLSYAKPKPIWKNLIIMVANTVAIFVILQVGARTGGGGAAGGPGSRRKACSGRLAPPRWCTGADVQQPFLRCGFATSGPWPSNVLSEGGLHRDPPP